MFYIPRFYFFEEQLLRELRSNLPCLKSGQRLRWSLKCWALVSYGFCHSNAGVLPHIQFVKRGAFLFLAPENRRAKITAARNPIGIETIPGFLSGYNGLSKPIMDVPSLLLSYWIFALARTVFSWSVNAVPEEPVFSPVQPRSFGRRPQLAFGYCIFGDTSTSRIEDCSSDH